MNKDQRQIAEIIIWLRRLTIVCLLILLVLIGIGMVLLRMNPAAMVLYVIGHGTLIFLAAYSFYKILKFRKGFYQKQAGEDSNKQNENAYTEP